MTKPNIVPADKAHWSVGSIHLHIFWHNFVLQ